MEPYVYCCQIGELVLLGRLLSATWHDDLRKLGQILGKILEILVGKKQDCPTKSMKSPAASCLSCNPSNDEAAFASCIPEGISAEFSTRGVVDYAAKRLSYLHEGFMRSVDVDYEEDLLYGVTDLVEVNISCFHSWRKNGAPTPMTARTVHVLSMFQTLHGPYGACIARHTRIYGPYGPYLGQHTRK